VGGDGVVPRGGAAVRTLIALVNASQVWVVLGVPLGMLAGEWWYALRDMADKHDREWYEACVRPGAEQERAG
jgi:hypothetical protein